MRKVTYSAAVSLDGYIAGPEEAMDWLRWSDDAAEISAASFKGVDTLLMGRKTYEFAARSGGGAGQRGVRTYVFSRTLASMPDGVEIVREDAAGFVRGLKTQQAGEILLMGGGELASSLVDAGVVDEVDLNVHPVLLGGGAPLFRPMARRVELELIEARALSKGCVLQRYRAAP